MEPTLILRNDDEADTTEWVLSIPNAILKDLQPTPEELSIMQVLQHMNTISSTLGLLQVIMLAAERALQRSNHGLVG